MKGETIMDLYDRTISNCKFYEEEGKRISLNNEIGVLRGIAYCMELVGVYPLNDTFSHFIELQNEFRAAEQQTIS